MPAPAATNATVVEMLNVPARSPPVPHVSRTSFPGGGVIRIAFCRITSAAAAISVIVSPFMERQERNEATWAGEASPPMIIRIASRMPSADRFLRPDTAAIASWMSRTRAGPAGTGRSGKGNSRGAAFRNG